MMLHVARSKRPTLLIVGCGDVGLRVVGLLRDRYRVFALTSSRERMPALRAAGAEPLLGDLDDRESLRRLAGIAESVLHLAPPASSERVDRRTQHLLDVLCRSSRVRRIVYGSTTGVYGDCGGEFVDETRPVHPTTDRAVRRVDAERRLRRVGARGTRRVTLLRIPGIYGLDRVGGDPRERLRRGTPVLATEDDVYTNHIHADDLARACVAALRRGGPQRVVDVCDDTQMKMGDYFDLAADLAGLPRPRRVSREQRAEHFTPMALSFMSESRRIRNDRLRRELTLVLRYPTVREGLAGLAADAAIVRSPADDAASSAGPAS
jgi:nucleoside-diphosphate-sugar epimerase